jgi:hypothetical protein
LGLIEEWVLGQDDVNALSTAKAASATLALTSCDLDVARALCREDCKSTFIAALRTGHLDIIHRIIVALMELTAVLDGDTPLLSTFTTDADLLLVLEELSVDERCSTMTKELLSKWTDTDKK